MPNFVDPDDHAAGRTQVAQGRSGVVGSGPSRARPAVSRAAGWGHGMRRVLFSLAVALSLVLCAATIALWVRSYLAWDSVVLPLPFGRSLVGQTTRPGAVDARVAVGLDRAPRHVSGDTWYEF